MKAFEKIQKMCDDEMDIRLAPLKNIIKVNIYGAKGEITIGVPREVAQDWMDGKEFVGGLLLANKEQFDSLGE